MVRITTKTETTYLRNVGIYIQVYVASQNRGKLSSFLGSHKKHISNFSSIPATVSFSKKTLPVPCISLLHCTHSVTLPNYKSYRTINMKYKLPYLEI
jgi:hypothetical protein